MKEIILASASPRRKELLKSVVDDFKIIPSNVSETYPDNLNSFEVSLYISDLKAYDIYKKHPNSLVIGCDTTIVFKNEVIGKPINKKDAKQTLLKFSNNMHYVVSAITIYYENKKHQINSINEVYFKSLTEDQIDRYLENDE